MPSPHPSYQSSSIDCTIGSSDERCIHLEGHGAIKVDRSDEAPFIDWDGIRSTVEVAEIDYITTVINEELPIRIRYGGFRSR